MELSTQLMSLIFSFAYGIIVSYLFNINYNFIYKSSFLYKIVINILFCVNLGLIYFLSMKLINNGVIHIYFVLMFLLGFSLFVKKYSFLRKFIQVKESVVIIKKKKVKKNKKKLHN
jgi:hypothetical protein